jgi:hypothetical protein
MLSLTGVEINARSVNFAGIAGPQKGLPQLFHYLFQNAPRGPGFGLGERAEGHVHEVQLLDESGLVGVHI